MAKADGTRMGARVFRITHGTYRFRYTGTRLRGAPRPRFVSPCPPLLSPFLLVLPPSRTVLPSTARPLVINRFGEPAITVPRIGSGVV